MARLLVGDDADLHDVEIYDPSADTGTLLMALSHQIGEDKCTIFSQDISQRSNKMLKLNLILNGLVSSLDHAIQGDTLLSPYHRSDDQTELRQFDFVVSNPPFKMDFSDSREKLAAMDVRFWGGVPNIPPKDKSKMAIYTMFVQHVVNSLKPDGSGAIVVPTGFLTAKNGVDKTVLHRLVDDRLVTGIVAMPSNVFANTGTNVSVVFLDKASNHQDVILIDASGLGEEYKEGNLQKRRLRDDEISLIVDTFQERNNVDGFSVAVGYEEIKQKNYSLSPGQYFDIKIEYIDLSPEEFSKSLATQVDSLNSLFERGNELSTTILAGLSALSYSRAQND
ncbi:N-6 DNA methylase [Trueperella pyogenes]|uniref:N-6 DNA methylase n=1 Tax=Trueperella pyogenes TaxID=1661 RepID=UPI0023DDF3CC|nr:class I SAM-dependent DNA methyltransferase [Trueperella pyogenes]